jgi:hypothetical protein
MLRRPSMQTPDVASNQQQAAIFICLCLFRWRNSGPGRRRIRVHQAHPSESSSLRISVTQQTSSRSLRRTPHSSLGPLEERKGLLIISISLLPIRPFTTSPDPALRENVFLCKPAERLSTAGQQSRCKMQRLYGSSALSHPSLALGADEVGQMYNLRTPPSRRSVLSQPVDYRRADYSMQDSEDERTGPKTE